MSAEIAVDVTSVPQDTINVLADATLDFIHDLLRRPGMKEAMDARIAEAKKEAQRDTKS